MATEYEQEVDALKGQVLRALQEHSEPDKAAVSLLQATVPTAVNTQQDGTLMFKPLSTRDRERLGAAIHAATGGLLAASLAAKKEIMQYAHPGREQPALAELLDAVIWIIDQKTLGLETALPGLVLERVVEAVSVGECEGVFAFLDGRIAFFKQPVVYKACYLSLLRTCNMLLRRLSKSQNAMLCGRILLFLAKLLPLTERSGVNLHGAFNTHNTTPVEEVQEGATDSEGRPVDAELYRTFWGLQAYFSDPPRALQAGSWARVATDMRRVLEKFRAVPVSITESAPGSGGRQADGLGVSVKYLSSSRLLGLQLRDATLRRHFLLQCLILMHWCEKPYQKEMPNALKGLRGKPLDDLLDLRKQAYAALEATPEEGGRFAAAVRHILAQEDAWAAWKKASCPGEPMQRPPAKMPPGAPPASELAPLLKRRRLSAEAYYGVRVGTDELDRLWNLSEDNLSMLGADDRGGFKSLRQLMEPVVNDLNEPSDDDQLKASRSKVYSWKTLRVLARENLHIFSQTVAKGGDLEVAARMLYPDEVPPPAAAPSALPKPSNLTAGLPASTPADTAAAADTATKHEAQAPATTDAGAAAAGEPAATAAAAAAAGEGAAAAAVGQAAPAAAAAAAAGGLEATGPPGNGSAAPDEAQAVGADVEMADVEPGSEATAARDAAAGEGSRPSGGGGGGGEEMLGEQGAPAVPGGSGGGGGSEATDSAVAAATASAAVEGAIAAAEAPGTGG